MQVIEGGKRRRYTKRQKVTAIIAATAANPSQAAEQTGIPRTNIRRWLDDPEMAEYGQKTREEIAQEARALSVKVLSEIRDRLPEFEPRDLSVLLGILTDKAQLLSGEATARTETRELLADFDDHEREAMSGWLRDIAAERLQLAGRDPDAGS